MAREFTRCGVALDYDINGRIIVEVESVIPLLREFDVGAGAFADALDGDTATTDDVGPDGRRDRQLDRLLRGLCVSRRNEAQVSGSTHL